MTSTVVFDTFGQAAQFADNSSIKGASFSSANVAGSLFDVMVKLTDTNANTDPKTRETGTTTFTLNADVDGQPGGVIQQLGTLADATLHYGSVSTVDISGFSAVVLAPGTRYWIELSDTGSQAWQVGKNASGTGTAGQSYFDQASAGASPMVAPDSEGAFLMQVTEAVACFCAGTSIRTDRGDVAVEALRAGDAVWTEVGGFVPVRWMGHRRIDLTQVVDREGAQPVRIAAGSFGGGLPLRDLRLSPEHAVFVDGFLVPVRHLVDGAAIAVDWDADEAVYWHVELDRHGVLLAEGLPCESWLDTGNRGMFANTLPPVPSGERPTAASAWAAACAPLLEDGPALAVIRRELSHAAGWAGSQSRLSNSLPSFVTA